LIQTSAEYQQKIALDGRDQKVSVLITLHNGYTYLLSNPDIMEDGVSFSDGTSEEGAFSIGTFVSKCLTVKLFNFDGRLMESQFEGSTVALKLGLVLSPVTPDFAEKVEWVYPGTFYTGEHSQSGGIITLTAYDNAAKFDRKYDSTLAYPATLYQILWDACKNCGVELANVYFANMDYVVDKRPSDDSTTYADIVSSVAQLAGCFARCNNTGALVLGWYDMDRFYPESGDILDGGDFGVCGQADTLDGGSFYPQEAAVDGGTLLDCSEADTADGGDFSSYGQDAALNGGDFLDYGHQITDVVFGGVFRKNLQPPVEISSLSSCSVPTEDVKITGVKIIPADSKKQPVMKGTNGYVISIEKNALAQENLDLLLDGVAKQLIDFQFRPMDVSAWDNPSIEAGDVVVLVDDKGNRHNTIISNLTYSFGNYEKFSADAESESDSQADLVSGSTKATAALQKNTEEAASATNGRIDTLKTNTEASVATINGQINLIQASKADIVFIQAKYLTADDAKANYATINNLAAAQADITNLKTDKLSATDAALKYATVDSLKAANADINSLKADKLDVTTASATYATVDNLTAANGSISSLQSDSAKIISLLSDNAGIGSLSSGTVSANYAALLHGTLGDAQIGSLSVGKLLAGNISTDKFTVQSDSGNLSISKNTLHVWDANGKERVSLGLNGSDYNLTVRAADGQTTIFGASGVTHAGITDGAVDDSKVAADANINGSKLNIESTIAAFNGATTLLKSSRIQYDPTGQSLEVAFQNLSGTVSSQGSTLSTQGTSITAIQGNIDSKIWESDITSAVNGIQVGGRNLAQHTSSSFTTPITNFSGITNDCRTVADVLTDGLSVGDTLTVHLVYKYDNVVAVSGQTASCWIQGSGAATSWNAGSFNGSPPFTLSGSGQHEFLYSFPVTADHLKNHYWSVNVRHDYVQSGSVQWKMFKVEKGTKATDWSPAPEDVQSQIDTHSSEISQNATAISSKVEQTVYTSGMAGKADKSTLVSEINQSAEAIKISASKIDLTGYATFSSLETAGTTKINGDNIDTTNLKAQRIYNTSNDIYAEIGTVSFEDQSGSRSASGITIYSGSKYHGGVASTYDSNYDWITMSDASGKNSISFGQDAITTASPSNTLYISSGINSIFMINNGRSGDGILIESSGPALSIKPNGIYCGAEDWDDGSTDRHWHKYQDGTLEQWGYTGSHICDITTAYGSMFWKHGYTYPLPPDAPAFVGNRYTHVTITSSGLATALNEAVATDGKTLKFDIQNPHATTGLTFAFSYLVVGRWK
jgi:hypothetical protein